MLFLSLESFCLLSFSLLTPPSYGFSHPLPICACTPWFDLHDSLIFPGSLIRLLPLPFTCVHNLIILLHGWTSDRSPFRSIVSSWLFTFRFGQSVFIPSFLCPLPLPPYLSSPPYSPFFAPCVPFPPCIPFACFFFLSFAHASIDSISLFPYWILPCCQSTDCMVYVTRNWLEWHYSFPSFFCHFVSRMVRSSSP